MAPKARLEEPTDRQDFAYLAGRRSICRTTAATRADAHPFKKKSSCERRNIAPGVRQRFIYLRFICGSRFSD
jgi:hypothetical protein